MTRLLFVALVLCAGTLPAAAQPAGDVTAFCRMHKDLDDPGKAFFGAGFERGKVPPQVEATGATDWRCRDGRVLLCLNSADGGACSKKDPSRKPRPILEEVCADDPEADFIARYASGYSSSTWRCTGGKLAIIGTVPLDRRGFMTAAWLRYVVRDGIVVAPREDDVAAGPR